MRDPNALLLQPNQINISYSGGLSQWMTEDAHEENMSAREGSCVLMWAESRESVASTVPRVVT